MSHFAYLMPKIYLGHQVLVHPYPNAGWFTSYLPPRSQQTITLVIYSLQR